MSDKVQRYWAISFSENGEEYHGHLTVCASECERVDEKTLVADGVRIIIDEYWIGEPEDVTPVAEVLHKKRTARTPDGR